MLFELIKGLIKDLEEITVDEVNIIFFSIVQLLITIISLFSFFLDTNSLMTLIILLLFDTFFYICPLT